MPKCDKCSARNSTPKKNAAFVGIFRSIVTLASLGLAVALGALIDSVKNVKKEHSSENTKNFTITWAFLILVYVIVIIHFVVSIFIICIAKLDKLNARVIKRWVTIDLAITAIYIVSLCIIFATAPLNKLYIILGVMVMSLSVYLSYRSWYTLHLYTKDVHNQVVHQVSTLEVTDGQT